MTKEVRASEVTVTLTGIGVGGSHTVNGYMDGTFLTVSRSVDTFSLSVGADGQTARVHNADASGTITLVLKQSSDSNDVLSNSHLADQLAGQGAFAIQVKDPFGETTIASAAAWVKKPADVTYAKDGEEGREWVIECADLEMLIGGNQDIVV
jgi:hypothetical protein